MRLRVIECGVCVRAGLCVCLVCLPVQVDSVASPQLWVGGWVGVGVGACVCVRVCVCARVCACVCVSALGLLSLAIHSLIYKPLGGAGNGGGTGMICCAVSHGVVLQASALAELAVVFNAGYSCPTRRILYCRTAPSAVEQCLCFCSNCA